MVKNFGLTEPVGAASEEELRVTEVGVVEDGGALGEVPPEDLTFGSETIGGSETSETFDNFERLVKEAPSGEKIVNKCDVVKYAAVAIFNLNSKVNSWEPISIFGELTNEQQLQSFVNKQLYTIRDNFLGDAQEELPTVVKYGEGDYKDALIKLTASLLALSIVSNGINLTEKAIEQKVKNIKELLIHKNISYQNSALEPVSVFGTLTAKDQLYSRMNDKLNRIKNNKNYQSEGYEDAVDDLIGYLVLLLVHLDQT